MPSNRFYPQECARQDTGSMPCAGGSCSAPGGTPTFLALSPMYALRRRARLTGRLPHGRLRKPVENCYRLTPDSYWEESLPWRPSQLRSEFNRDWRVPGQLYPKSQFRSLTRCGALRTKRACECDDIRVDVCAGYDPNNPSTLCYDNQCQPKPCKDVALVPCEPCEECCDCCGDCDGECCEKPKCECDACECKDCEQHCDKTGCSCDPCKCDPCECHSDQNQPDDQAEKDDPYCDCHCNCGSCPMPCPPPDDPCERIVAQQRRWIRQRRAFKPSKAFLGNPAGRRDSVGGTMKGVRTSSYRPQSKFRVRQASRKFTGSGNPEEFANSTRCRFAGSNGPAELRAAICQFGPQGRRSGANQCGC